VHENLTGCLENACLLACSAQPADCLLTDINEKNGQIGHWEPIFFYKKIKLNRK